MVEKRAIDYLFESIGVLSGNITYIVVPVCLTSCTFLSRFMDRHFDFIYLFFIFAALGVVVPLYYGQFIEILNTGSKRLWMDIFKKYWIKVFIVSLILRAPVLIFGWILSEMDFVKGLLSLAIGILTIYVLPLVLLRNGIYRSIEIGVKALIGNIRFSAPFIAVLITLPFIFSATRVFVDNLESPFALYSSSVILILISTVADFVIFISAALVLKDKLLKV